MNKSSKNFKKNLKKSNAKNAYANKGVDQKKKISARVLKKTGFNISGRGDYNIPGVSSATGLMRRLAEPFMNRTASVGLVNRGARFLGNKLGSWTGVPGAGEALGNAASYAARFMGFGDYSVQSNCLANEGIATFKGSEDAIIAGREFIANVNGSNLFALQSYIINPGNSVLFPWLSNVARCYEEWAPMGIVFEYRTTSAFATGTTNSALGTIIMATDYDVVDTQYQTKQSMLISTFSNSQAPCTSFYHPVECASKKNPLNTYYVQSGTTVADYPDDPRFSALGNFQIAAEGMQVTNVVGELWVSYKFRFSKPQLELEATRAYYHGKFSDIITGTATSVKSEGITPTCVVSGVSTNAEYVDIDRLPAGDYLFAYSNQGTSAMTVNGTSANNLGFANGASVLFHSQNNAGIYGVIDTDVGDSNTNTSAGRNTWQTEGFVMFRMTGLTSKIAVPLYTWQNAGVVVSYRDFYISKIPAYSNTTFSNEDFIKKLMANKSNLLALMNASDKDEQIWHSMIPTSTLGGPEIGKPEEDSDGETPDLEDYRDPPAAPPRLIRQDATSGLSSSSSASSSSRSGSKK